jgi:hypothetical protein
MSEHFTRNTEAIRCWCASCGQMTEHPVSNGHIGRCPNDHSKPKGPVKAAIPTFEYEVGAAKNSKPAKKEGGLARGTQKRVDKKERGKMKKDTKQLIAVLILAALVVIAVGWYTGASGSPLAPALPEPQSDRPRIILNGIVAPPDASAGQTRDLSTDNHGVVTGNSVSTFNASQGSANGAIGYAVGQALPAWTAEIGEFAHITGTTATAVKATSGVLIQINVNTAAIGTVSVFDLASASCTGTPSTNVAAVLTATATSIGVFPFHAHFVNGICAKASAAMDLTAVYQ